jgi:SAM-dependent methyltransferase
MSASDRVHWDTIYRTRGETGFPDPDPLLYQTVPPLRPGESAHALDLASGLGQNGLWLAAQGYTVDLIDISRVALTQARDEATRRHLRTVNFFQLDLDSAQLQTSAYDLICVIRFLERSLLPQIRAAMRPGGRIIYQTFNIRFLSVKPDMNPAYLLEIGELAGFFGDWRILRNSEPDHVSQLVAVKPEIYKDRTED